MEPRQICCTCLSVLKWGLDCCYFNMCMDSAHCTFCSNHIEVFFLPLLFCYAHLLPPWCLTKKTVRQDVMGQTFETQTQAAYPTNYNKYIVSSTDTQGLCLIQPLNQQHSCVSSDAEQENHNTLFIMLRETRNLFGSSHYKNDKVMRVCYFCKNGDHKQTK